MNAGLLRLTGARRGLVRSALSFSGRREADVAFECRSNTGGDKAHVT
jgi:hypothetical protein